MAVIQTNYVEDLVPGYPGMVANGETSNRITRTIQDVAGIGFGKPAYRGAGDHDCTATAAPGAFLGVTIAHEVLGIVAGQTADIYPRYENVAIMTQGVIWVTAGEAVTDGAPAYATAGGDFVATASGNTALEGWFFDTTAASGALVKLAKR